MKQNRSKSYSFLIFLFRSAFHLFLVAKPARIYLHLTSVILIFTSALDVELCSCYFETDCIDKNVYFEIEIQTNNTPSSGKGN